MCIYTIETCLKRGVTWKTSGRALQEEGLGGHRPLGLEIVSFQRTRIQGVHGERQEMEEEGPHLEGGVLTYSSLHPRSLTHGIFLCDSCLILSFESTFGHKHRKCQPKLQRNIFCLLLCMFVKLTQKSSLSRNMPQVQIHIRNEVHKENSHLSQCEMFHMIPYDFLVSTQTLRKLSCLVTPAPPSHSHHYLPIPPPTALTFHLLIYFPISCTCSQVSPNPILIIPGQSPCFLTPGLYHMLFLLPRTSSICASCQHSADFILFNCLAACDTVDYTQLQTCFIFPTGRQEHVRALAFK